MHERASGCARGTCRDVPAHAVCRYEHDGSLAWLRYSSQRRAAGEHCRRTPTVTQPIGRTRNTSRVSSGIDFVGCGGRWPLDRLDRLQSGCPQRWRGVLRCRVRPEQKRLQTSTNTATWSGGGRADDSTGGGECAGGGRAALPGAFGGQDVCQLNSALDGSAPPTSTPRGRVTYCSPRGDREAHGCHGPCSFAPCSEVRP